MPYKKSSYSILMIDDNEGDYLLIRGLMANMGEIFKLEWVSSYEFGFEAVLSNSHDLFLIDDTLGEKNGLDLIQEIRAIGFDKPAILLTGVSNTPLDIEALRLGASDFLVKGSLSGEGLEHSLRHCIQRYEYTRMYLEHQRLLRSFFNTNIVPTFIMNTDCILVETNPAFNAKFGKDKLRQSLGSIFANEDDFNLDLKGLQSGRPIQNWSAFLVDSELNTIESSLNISRYHTEVDYQVYYFGVVNDMAQLRLAERQLALAEQVSMTGKMARIMAHEIRNPLTNINLAADQLREELEEQKIPEDHLAFIDLIKRNSQRINNLIKDLLNSTKETKIKKQESNLTEVIRSALKLVEDRMLLRKISLNADQLIDGVIMQLDVERLKLAFLNIFTNAIEAMENTELKELVIEMSSNKREIQVLISDTGVGMTEEVKKRMFEPFYSKRSGGVGLGMTTVLHVFTAHDANIHVESKVGKGTKFHIAFLRS